MCEYATRSAASPARYDDAWPVAFLLNVDAIHCEDASRDRPKRSCAVREYQSLPCWT